MKKKFIFLLFLLILGYRTHAWPLSSEQATVNAIQKKFESVLTFKADFEQKAYVKMINRTEITRGTVQIKKPGKMKWVYESPDPQILVSNQKILWIWRFVHPFHFSWFFDLNCSPSYFSPIYHLNIGFLLEICFKSQN
jgi:outer membrane lipoprotein-sorting protein